MSVLYEIRRAKMSALKERLAHGLINYIETIAKCCHLKKIYL
jgi:hypothetical protein